MNVGTGFVDKVPGIPAPMEEKKVPEATDAEEDELAAMMAIWANLLIW